MARSVEAFAMCVKEFSRISMGRSNPVERNANPISDNERTIFLCDIAEINRSDCAGVLGLCCWSAELMIGENF